MGLALWPASPAAAADCVTAIEVPAGLDHEAVRLRMRDRYGVATSPDSGVGNLVRIAHMGPAASGLYPVTGLMALGRALADLGAAVRHRGRDRGRPGLGLRRRARTRRSPLTPASAVRRIRLPGILGTRRGGPSCIT